MTIYRWPRPGGSAAGNLPADAGEFELWRERLRKKVGELAGHTGKGDPISAAASARSTVDGLTHTVYTFEPADRGMFRAVLTIPDEGGLPRPAVLVCPGGDAIVDQVTGAAPPDFPDRAAAERFARTGFVTLTLDYGFAGALPAEVLEGRDEAAVIAQLCAITGRPLLGVLAADALDALTWLSAQPSVCSDRVALFGHGLGAAIALHAQLLAEVPIPLCVAGHLGTYDVVGTGHAASALPGIARHADLPDLFAAVAPAPLQVQYGVRDRSLDAEDAAAAGRRITELYDVADAAGEAEVVALGMGHATGIAEALSFLDRAIGDASTRKEASRPAVPAQRISFDPESRREIIETVGGILDSGVLTLGSTVARFEGELEVWTGRPTVAVDSGSSALEIALRRIGVSGRLVLVPVNTFFATAAAAIRAGAAVDFVDMDSESLGLDQESLRERLDHHEDVAAVIVMHTGGVIAPTLHRTIKECHARGVPVIEDAAHAFGSTLDGRPAGGIADFGAYSFYPTKVLTSGEGGAITSASDEDVEVFRQWRDHGRTAPGKTTHERPGSNWRLSEFHAAVGLAQVRRFAEHTRRRADIAARYDAELRDLPGLRIHRLPPEVTSNWYKYIVSLEDGVDRADLKARLREHHRVSLAGEVYGVLLHDQPFFAQAFAGREFPHAAAFARRHACLPVYPDLQSAEVDRIIAALRKELS